ncbi:Glia-derived nexin [Clonorchis sinensis]|uniref:Glia-derived nexin n=1 Tax=Clonorchis sinensis TaxID=79923 RepID=A0A3R7CF41_CLOSI|nr:Glia-derived nexin [Clonorchis sinensis]
MDQDYLACPLGVLFLLSSIFASRGVGGQTGVELVRALRLRSPIPDNNLQRAMYESKLLYRELVDDLVAEQSVVNRRRLGIITVSNGMFVRDDYRMKSDFLRSVQNDFQVTVQQINFRNQSDAADKINRWIYSETRGLVLRFVSRPQELSSGTRLALFNVVTFRENWRMPFASSGTTTAEFRLDSYKNAVVSMMHVVEEMPYASLPDKGIMMIRKFFRNTRFTLIVVLPTERWESKGIERVLAGQYNIRDLVAAQQPEVVSLKMPKFRMQQTSDLTSALKSMGVISIFQRGEADFSGMTDTDDMHLGMVKQGAVMSVNEIGVEPTGVTASISGASTRLEPTVEFIVDQPFVCMIYDEQFKLPVFTARVIRPQL